MGALRGVAQLEQLACQRDRLAEIYSEGTLPVGSQAQRSGLLPEPVFGAVCQRGLDHDPNTSAACLRSA